MAVVKIRDINGNPKGYQGLSTDTKPVTDIKYSEEFYEVDTKKTFIFDSNINTLTSNGWWEK